MISKISIFSHRGGQTDYEKARNDPATHNMPAENTLAAFKRALDGGADGIELDVIRTKDDKLAVIHTADLKQHIFNRGDENIGYVGEYTLKELQSNFRVGPKADGIIPELSDVMKLVADYQAKGRDITLNIELKDVKGCDVEKSDKTDVKPLVAEYIKQGNVDKDKIILSSFSYKDIEVVEQMNLGVKLAVLFDEEKAGGSKVYINDSDTYLAFSPENIAMVQAAIPSLYAVHGEIKEVDEKALIDLKQRNLALGTWSAAEDHPTTQKAFFDNFKKLIQKHDVKANIITNFAHEMQPVLADELELDNKGKKVD